MSGIWGNNIKLSIFGESHGKGIGIVIDDNVGLYMKKRILKAKKEKDSVGGIVEVIIKDIPVGIGSPFFNSVESEGVKWMN